MVNADGAHILNEIKVCRQARNALAAVEIELMLNIARVADQRRVLSSVEENEGYRFHGKDGAVGFTELFGDKDTLVIYSFMYVGRSAKQVALCERHN